MWRTTWHWLGVLVVTAGFVAAEPYRREVTELEPTRKSDESTAPASQADAPAPERPAIQGLGLGTAADVTGQVVYLERLGPAMPVTECPPAPQKLVAPSDLPEPARKLFEGYQEEARILRKKTEDDIANRGLALVDSLQALQDEFTRAAKLDEAVAIRDLVRRLQAARLNLHADPGTLYSYVSKIGETFLFEVTGKATGGSVWGTEFYTYDSPLAVAAVHAGALRDGETGVVAVTMLRSPEPHRGSTANGVTSSSWGVYSASYSVKRWQPAPK
jgi:hypothetical protein